MRHRLQPLLHDLNGQLTLRMYRRYGLRHFRSRFHGVLRQQAHINGNKREATAKNKYARSTTLEISCMAFTDRVMTRTPLEAVFSAASDTSRTELASRSTCSTVTLISSAAVASVLDCSDTASLLLEILRVDVESCSAAAASSRLRILT